MNIKSIIFVVIVLGLVGILIWSGNDSKVQPAKSPSPQKPTQMQRSPHGPMNSGTELPTITSAHIQVKNTKDEISGPYELFTGKSTKIDELGISLKLSDFYTHWNWDGMPVNRTFNEQNPAVKVEIIRADGSTSYGWAFMNVPFFSMEGHSDGGGGSSDKLTFTMLSYNGLELPKSANNQEDA